MSHVQYHDQIEGHVAVRYFIRSFNLTLQLLQSPLLARAKTRCVQFVDCIWRHKNVDESHQLRNEQGGRAFGKAA